MRRPVHRPVACQYPGRQLNRRPAPGVQTPVEPCSAPHRAHAPSPEPVRGSPIRALVAPHVRLGACVAARGSAQQASASYRPNAVSRRGRVPEPLPGREFEPGKFCSGPQPLSVGPRPRACAATTTTRSVRPRLRSEAPTPPGFRGQPSTGGKCRRRVDSGPAYGDTPFRDSRHPARRPPPSAARRGATRAHLDEFPPPPSAFSHPIAALLRPLAVSGEIAAVTRRSGSRVDSTEHSARAACTM